ncbi:hypothetical protein ACFY0A_34195 [Streptomyces sp. NPDC001698]|uniref:hypothetical protein n=1 Tax=unclassified Streptomyces TaxID=2593676 RepID=UPI00367B2749
MDAALDVDGFAQELVDFLLQVLLRLLGADDCGLGVVGPHPDPKQGQAAGEVVGGAEQAHHNDVAVLPGRGQFVG